MVASSTLLTRVLDALALAIVLVIAIGVPVLVAGDARRRGDSWARALRSGLATLALLPLGLGLYLLLGQPARAEGEESA